MQLELLEEIEPWGERRADFRAARICQTIIAAAGGKSSFKDVLAMFDFEPKPDQSDEEMLDVFDGIAG